MVAVTPAVEVPPSGSTQDRSSKLHPDGSVDSLTDFWPAARPSKVIWPVPPVVVMLKLDGSPSPEPVNRNVSSPPVASLMMVSEPVACTAAADSDRSWFPRLLRFQSLRRMWYGEPEMPPAEFPSPQSAPRPMCPPHASTAVSLSAWKDTVTRVSDCASDRSPTCAYEIPVIVPPNNVIFRSAPGSELNLACGCPGAYEGLASCGSGMGKSDTVAESPVTPSVGSTSSAVWPKTVWGSRRS